MKERLLLIDGHSIMNRAFYGLPNLTNSDGLHTNAVYGFLTILFKILEEEQAGYLAVAFDLAAPTFRHKMYEEYKGTRKPMPEELREQIPVMKEVLAAMGIPVITKEGYEADDILGTLSREGEEKGMDVTILSGDRDLLQLATKHVKIRIPKTKGGQTTIEDYLEEDVKKAYQVTPTEFIDVKALMGDASDNIPGIPGVGEKTATKIIVQFGSIENAYAHLEEIKPNKARESLREHYDLAVMSKKLAAINVHAPDVSLQKDSAELGNIYTQEAYEYFRRLEFKNLLNRFDCTGETNAFEETFCVIEDFNEAETFLTKAQQQSCIGIQLLIEGKTVLGAAVSLGEEKTAYIPAEGFITSDYLQGRLKDLADHVTIAALDIKELMNYIEIPSEQSAFDASVAAYLMNPLKSSYLYDELAKEYLNLMLVSQEETLGKLSLLKGIQEKTQETIHILCSMAYVAQAVREPLLEALERDGMLSVFTDIEMPLVFTLHSMESWGIRAEADELREYSARLQVRIQELEGQIYEQAGEAFNINSPKQLGVILFEKLQLPGGKKTKTGYSTAADVLEKLAPDHQIVRDILEYRQLAKLKSTYADGLVNYIGEDGRIHSHFNQTITATGRISSTEPNLQNIPIRMELGRLIRKVFVPEEGYVFMDADYSQIELRVLAHMSGDENLIQAYREAQDIHRMTASQVFHIPFEEVTDLQRRNAKAVNFGIVYGISSFGLSQDLSITRKEAAQYIQSYFDTYPKIKGFLDGLVSQGKEQGYVTTMFGRRRPVPELKSSNFMQRSFGERIAMNSPIQGTAADIIKIAMNRVQKRLEEEKLQSRLILQVHDELLIETKNEEIEQVRQILEEEMKAAAHLEVSLEVDVHTGQNWYEAK